MQVERLSKLLGTEAQKIEEAGEQIRSQVINSTVNVDKRLQKLYELIENDLLGHINDQVVYISPYKVDPGTMTDIQGYCVWNYSLCFCYWPARKARNKFENVEYSEIHNSKHWPPC